MMDSNLKLNAFLMKHPHIGSLLEKHFLDLTNDERTLVFQYLELKKLEECHKEVTEVK